MTDQRFPERPINRSLILKLLRDPESGHDEDDDKNIVKASSHAVAARRSLAEENDDILALPEMSLSSMRGWLDHQVKRYQIQIDAALETDTTNEFKPLSRYVNTRPLDTSILERIRKGGGTREPNYEDLLAPIRLFRHSNSVSTNPLTQSYTEMKDVLHAWNIHVAKRLKPETGARKTLLYALQSRTAELNIGSIKRQSADGLRDSARHLADAIQAFRPETADFRTRDNSTILIIVLAHTGIAGFDIDSKLKYWIFYTLVQERAFNPWMVERNRRIVAEGRQIQRGMKPKKEKQYQGLDPMILDTIRRSIINELQTARRNLEGRYLAQIYNLSIAQSVQKSLLKDLHIVDPLLTLPNTPKYTPFVLQADITSQSNSQIDYNDEESSLAVLSRHIDRAHDIHRARVFTRAVKFAGKDLRNVTSAERLREVHKRLRHPKTIKMMANAVAGMKSTKGLVKEILHGTDTLAKELGTAKKEMEEDRRNVKEWLECMETNDGFGGDGG